MEGVLSEGVLSEGVLSGGGFVLPGATRFHAEIQIHDVLVNDSLAVCILYTNRTF